MSQAAIEESLGKYKLYSHFVTAYPSPSPYPQVHSLVGLCLYSCLATRFFMGGGEMQEGRDMGTYVYV